MHTKKIIWGTFIALICTMIAILAISASYEIKRAKERAHRDSLTTYYDKKVYDFELENKRYQNGVDVVFLGDSLTDGCNIAYYYQGINALNRGISGDTTTGLLARLDGSAYQVSPKVIVMLIGINNINNMFNDYEQLLIELGKNLPNTKLIVLSLTPLAQKFNLNDKVISANERIKQYASVYNLTYVDLYDALYSEADNGLKSNYTYDGLHFTDAGYKVISSIVKPVIEEILK